MNGGAIVFGVIFSSQLYAQQISANGNLGEVLAVKDQQTKVLAYQTIILPNYPNPFSSSTAFRFILPANLSTKLKIYDFSGRLVATLVDGYCDAGQHQVTFNGSNLASGIYLARLSAGNFAQTEKLVLLK